MNYAAGDVTCQAELVVMDYLKSWNCPQALNAFTKKLNASNASVIATERFSNDMKSKQKVAKSRASLLEYLVSTTEGNQGTLDPKGLTTTVSKAEFGIKWTSDEVRALKKAIKNTSSEANKITRWKEIAILVGNGKTKKQCYLKYKELKQERASAAAKKASPRHDSSSIRRNKPDDTSLRDLKSDEECVKSKKYLFDAGKTEEEDLFSKSNSSSSKFSDDLSAQSAVSRQSPATRDNATPTFEALEIEDCEDMGLLLSQSTTGQALSIRASTNVNFSIKSTTRALTTSDIAAVQHLLFGASKKVFGGHWDEQGFVFSTVRDLQYGLIQHQGGPCGVLAVVQGYVLRFLLEEAQSDWKNPEALHQEHSLVQALAYILWQSTLASQSPECVVAVKHSATAGQRRFMAGLKLLVATSEKQTRQIITAYLPQFMESNGSGLVQFVLSVLLTKGVDMIYSEMDQLARDTGGQLIGAHDYCTQELVNLLLCGYARSNVFNGDQTLGGTNASDSDALVLRGIPNQSVLGFLSLFEAYQNLVVGSFYKHPRVNIWVVCSESHYSVLFAADPRALNDGAFDGRSSVHLLYYDGLANQDEEIRLTVNILARADPSATVSHDDLIPPLDLVIRTKWPRATVDWNGIEPLL